VRKITEKRRTGGKRSPRRKARARRVKEVTEALLDSGCWLWPTSRDNPELRRTINERNKKFYEEVESDRRSRLEAGGFRAEKELIALAMEARELESKMKTARRSQQQSDNARKARKESLAYLVRSAGIKNYRELNKTDHPWAFEGTPPPTKIQLTQAISRAKQAKPNQ
jgi:hypothetical protein